MREVVRACVLAIFALWASSCASVPPLAEITVKDVDLPRVVDGIYAGNYRVPVPFGRIIMQPYVALEIRVSKNRFEEISIKNLPSFLTDDPKLGLMNLIDLIIKEQRLNVDAVGGASYTKKAVQKAAENAFAGYLMAPR
jgi:uncharacterized protein with FMN-binding domain